MIRRFVVLTVDAEGGPYFLGEDIDARPEWSAPWSVGAVTTFDTYEEADEAALAAQLSWSRIVRLPDAP